MRDVFDATNYKCGPAIRITGMEIDITATHKVSNEKVYSECKAHRDPIPADTLTKLLGNITIKEVDQGWLVTTSRLSKDAEGLKDEWETKPADQRRRLQIYTPERLIDLFISSGRVIDPNKIADISNCDPGNLYLLITNFGRYWAHVIPVSGIPRNVIIYNVNNGERVTDKELLGNLKSTDTSLCDLNWSIQLPVFSSGKGCISNFEEMVVDVAIGDNWADYRPARPQDFVGRHESQQLIMDFLNNALDGSTNTRLFSIRGPSGWGKSSLIAKLRARCSNRAYHNKLFMKAVDVRAAKTIDYVSAAILRCFSSAIESKFISPPLIPLQAGPPTAPLDSKTLRECFDQLKQRQKLIVLIFDQFEEVFTKPELSQLFDRLRSLALATDAYQSNFIVGFAWKSDAFLPQEHPAYFMWHQLKDRRLDIDLPPFGSKDVSQALTHFQTELGQRINPLLRSQLVQHCQGFPWLLKKLCIHVFQLVNSGLSQTQVLERGLDVKKLFNTDLSELSPKETLCLHEIAKLAPVEWVKIVDQFGNDTYTSLVDKRLIIRSGDRITAYWDIFRDYLNTGDIPYVPLSFTPSTEVRTLVRATISCLASGEEGLTNEMLSESMTIGTKSAMNVVADLLLFGLAEKKRDRIVSTIKIGKQKDINIEISRAIASALNNHIFTILIRRNIKKEMIISENDLLRISNNAFQYASLRDDTKRVYALRLAKYLTAVGFLERAADGWKVIDAAHGQLVLMPNVKRTGIFFGDSPPEKVIDLMQKLSISPLSKKSIEECKLGNALLCIITLGFGSTNHGIVSLEDKIRSKNIETTLAEAIAETKSFRIVSRMLTENSKISAAEIGRQLADQLHLLWSEASYIRRGYALRRWVEWQKKVILH